MKTPILSMLVAFTTLTMGLSVNAEVIQNEVIPFDVSVWVECANGGAGEDVYLTGKLHLLTATTEDSAGGYHVKWNSNQHLTGVGDVTGDKYQATGVTGDEFYFDLVDSYLHEETYVNNIHMIGQGKGTDFHLHYNMHLTVNANGEVTAEVDNGDLWGECK